jgi:hypothetical protein
MSKPFWKQTKGARIGSVDGFNLFFGALLGANLGTLERLPIWDYFKLIAALAITVAMLRMVSTSERRITALVGLAIYSVLIALILGSDDLRPQGLDPGDAQRLGVTLAVWILGVLIFEFAPTHEGDEPARTRRARDDSDQV